MKTGIHINKYVRKWLTEDAGVTALVDRKNIVPLVISPAAQPFITFQHGPIEVEYAKMPDDVVVDKVEVLIAIVARDYEQSIDIADAVRRAVEHKHYEDAEIYIPLITVSEISEDVEGDNYIQQILLDFEIQTKLN